MPILAAPELSWPGGLGDVPPSRMEVSGAHLRKTFFKSVFILNLVNFKAVICAVFTANFQKCWLLFFFSVTHNLGPK